MKLAYVLMQNDTPIGVVLYSEAAAIRRLDMAKKRYYETNPRYATDATVYWYLQPVPILPALRGYADFAVGDQVVWRPSSKTGRRTGTVVATIEAGRVPRKEGSRTEPAGWLLPALQRADCRQTRFIAQSVNRRAEPRDHISYVVYNSVSNCLYWPIVAQLRINESSP